MFFRPPKPPLQAECLKYEILDGFWCSRYLNDCIDLPNMIGLFASGATTSLVAKNGTKNVFVFLIKFHANFCTKLWFKWTKTHGFWILRCQKKHLNLPVQMVLSKVAPLISIVVKNETKNKLLSNVMPIFALNYD